MIDRQKTLTPQQIVQDYSHIFGRVYGREPSVLHLGGPWYEVNGETVHRLALLTEIERLRMLAPPPPPRRAVTDRGVINRLIAKLRGI